MDCLKGQPKQGQYKPRFQKRQNRKVKWYFTFLYPFALKLNETITLTDNGLALEQRPIAEDDVCPICQDQLLAKHLPVTYCR